jgi:hypothetical protein
MMTHSLPIVLSIFLSLVISLTSPVFAQTGGNGGGGSMGGSGMFGGGGGGAGLSNATTKKVVKIIKSGIGRCQRVEQVYRFDCYRQTYKLAANFLNGRPAYAGAQEALIKVEETLDRIMAQNSDPQAPPVRQGFQQYRPIKPAAVPKAKVELTKALDEAETILLRAPERTGKHYARIAEAVNSNKVLLRSRLYPDGDDLFQTAFA